jgi:prepilin signal peptidase PulO-like enzyme (type II secretory pathway)
MDSPLLALRAGSPYNNTMLFTAWIAFFFVMLFFLGSTVGSFLNVCIVRLPRGRSLIRPASCCVQCGKPIRWQDNIPLWSYWALRGRCRACGAPFSMRYFWIEFVTGLLFVAIYHLEIGRNIHHFEVWSWYESDYVFALMHSIKTSLALSRSPPNIKHIVTADGRT